MRASGRKPGFDRSFNRIAREEAVLDDAGSERAGKALEVARNVKFILVSNTLVDDVLILLVECGNCNSLVFEGVVGSFDLVDEEQRENRETVAKRYLFGELGFLTVNNCDIAVNVEDDLVVFLGNDAEACRCSGSTHSRSC